MTSSCIFCNFYVSLHLFKGFQHLLFLYIISKKKGDIIFTQNFAICLIKRIFVFSSFPIWSRIGISRFCVLCRQTASKAPMFVCIFCVCQGSILTRPCNIYILSTPTSSKCKELWKWHCPSASVFLSLHTQTQITSRDLRNLYSPNIRPFVLIRWCYL